MKTKTEQDVIGQALLDFYYDREPEDIIVHAPDFEEDVIPIAYLFRSFAQMPRLEQVALELSWGKVLDVGCGAGVHSLYLQDQQKLDVTSIDSSPGAVDICRKRGLQNAVCSPLLEFHQEKYHTILLLMNGIGLAGKLRQLSHFLNHLQTLLHPEGQVLLDSSDLRYLYDQEEDGGIWLRSHQMYYGEMQYSLTYKTLQSGSFDWLYLDFNSLSLAAEASGFHCDLVEKGDHYDFLAKLTLNPKRT